MKEYLIDTHAHIDMLEAPIESTLQLMKDFGVKKGCDTICRSIFDGKSYCSC